MHRKMVREQQNMIAYQYAVKALKNNSWVLQANTLFNNFGAAIPVTNNLNFVAMDNNQVSLQLAFNGFNPGPNGLGGITLTGWPSSINERVDKNGNITYTFNVMGAALFAQVTVRLGYGSNYSTVTVNSNTNGNELTFSGNLVPTIMISRCRRASCEACTSILTSGETGWQGRPQAGSPCTDL